MERHRDCLLVVLATVLTLAIAGEYCDDFEDGDFGVFWQQSSQDQGGQWKPSSYKELKKTIPQFPEPESGDTVVYLTPNKGSSYVSARLQMKDSYTFPAGSNMTFRYWLQSEWASSGTLTVIRVVRSEEFETLLSLTDQSGPGNLMWASASLDIPPLPTDEQFKILIFASTSVDLKGNIAIDDIIINGPVGLSKKCSLLTSTTSIPTTATRDAEPGKIWTAPAPTPAPGKYPGSDSDSGSE